MMQDASGSQPDQPCIFVRIVETITAKEPSASARMCRKMPCKFSFSWLWLAEGITLRGEVGLVWVLSPPPNAAPLVLGLRGDELWSCLWS